MIDWKYITAFWEADGSMYVSIHPSKYSPFGFYFQPYFRISQSVDKKDVVIAFRDFLRREGINAGLRPLKSNSKNKQDAIGVSVGSVRGCETVFRGMQPYIFTEARKNQVRLMLELLQMMKDKKHLSEQGFLRMIDLIDEMRKWKTRQSHPKYTREYFEELFKKQGGTFARKRKRGVVLPEFWSDIVQMRNSGSTLKEIGDKYGVTEQAIHYLINKKKIGELVSS